MPAYEAMVKVPSSAGSVHVKVTVEAGNSALAKAILEAQYGKGSVKNGPIRK
jgi:hypothetical protein